MLRMNVVITLVIFFFISCLGEGKLNLLSKNKAKNEARTITRKFIIFFVNDFFGAKRLL